MLVATSTPLTRVPTKNKGVTVYLKPEIYDALKAIALEEDRTMSKILGRVVTDWVLQRQQQK